MMAITVFALALLGIIALFALKAWEARSARYLAPGLRRLADDGADEVKRLIVHSQEGARRLPPALLYLTRTILHDAALGAAALARFLERQSHRAADMVSHKRGFERKETSNEFLKNMTDFKNGSELDSTSESGQNT
jgi:hypothetical protein